MSIESILLQRQREADEHAADVQAENDRIAEIDDEFERNCKADRARTAELAGKYQDTVEKLTKARMAEEVQALAAAAHTIRMFDMAHRAFGFKK